MTDIFTSAKRSEIMRSIRSKDTSPELKVRKALHRLGLRYRLHRQNLPGTPDLVLSKYKIIVQIRGCFWHQHGCKKSSIPKSNEQYWITKLEKNKNRDFRTDQQLVQLGWHVIVIWECEVGSEVQLANRITQVYKDCLLRLQSQQKKYATNPHH